MRCRRGLPMKMLVGDAPECCGEFMCVKVQNLEGFPCENCCIVGEWLFTALIVLAVL